MSRLNLGHTARSVFCLLSTLVSCREATPPQPVPGNVGPAGGTVELAGGAVVVRVPAGALSAPVLLEARPVTLSPKEGTLFVAGSGFTVGPSSVRFNAPVSLTLRIPQVGIPQGVLPGELRIVSVSNSVWNQLAPDSRSQEQGTLSASIISSGDFGVIGVPVASVTMSPSSAQVSSRHEVVFLRAEARDADGNFFFVQRFVCTGVGVRATGQRGF